MEARNVTRKYEYKSDRMQAEINLLKQEVSELEHTLARREGESFVMSLMWFFIGSALTAALLSLWCTYA